MHSRLMRVLLVLIGIGIVSAAGYFLKETDKTMAAGRAASDALRERARLLTATVADVRAGQVAYVARGQGEDFWMGHVSKVLPVLDEQMAAFGESLSAASAQVAFESASAAIENFHKLDSRAQEFAKGGNSLLAADLIFSDGLEATGTAATQIEAALNEELRARESALAGHRTEGLAVLGGAAGGMLLLLLVLGLTGSRPKAESVEVVEESAPSQPAVALSPVAPNLAAAARLCTDFARVSQSSELPGLLARAAKALEASGIIVWVAAPSGQDLRPAMSFGYPDQVVARMGSIPRDAANATAGAYRAGEMRTVSGDTFSNGALVAPLITSDGCIGVLSAEMKGGSEKDEGSQALAAIFAAQLATLVAAPAAAPAKTAAQA